MPLCWKICFPISLVGNRTDTRWALEAEWFRSGGAMSFNCVFRNTKQLQLNIVTCEWRWIVGQHDFLVEHHPEFFNQANRGSVLGEDYCQDAPEVMDRSGRIQYGDRCLEGVSFSAELWKKRETDINVVRTGPVDQAAGADNDTFAF